jgi:hypothetical protein
MQPYFVRYLTADYINAAVFCSILRQGRKQAKSTGAFSKSYRTRTRGGRRCSSGARGWSWVHRGWVWVVNPPQGGFSAVKTETGRGKVNELERRKRSKSTKCFTIIQIMSTTQHNATRDIPPTSASLRGLSSPLDGLDRTLQVAFAMLRRWLHPTSLGPSLQSALCGWRRCCRPCCWHWCCRRHRRHRRCRCDWGRVHTVWSPSRL